MRAALTRSGPQAVSDDARVAPTDAMTTYCLGYWVLPDNAKRPVGHYVALLPLTIRMIAGQRLILLTDDSRVVQLVRDCCTQDGVELLWWNRCVGDLPAFGLAAEIVQRTEEFGRGSERPSDFHREKGLLHYWRDLLGGGAAAYRQILAIWLSKVMILEEASRINPFASAQFAWIDASVSRFNRHRRNWNFATLPQQADKIAHYGSIMRKHGNPLSLNASFLRGDRLAWSRLGELYLAALTAAVSEPYPNDEETILHGVREKQPDAFLRVDAVNAPETV
jgi:hypothetical protein